MALNAILERIHKRYPLISVVSIDGKNITLRGSRRSGKKSFILDLYTEILFIKEYSEYDHWFVFIEYDEQRNFFEKVFKHTNRDNILDKCNTLTSTDIDINYQFGIVKKKIYTQFSPYQYTSFDTIGFKKTKRDLKSLSILYITTPVRFFSDKSLNDAISKASIVIQIKDLQEP